MSVVRDPSNNREMVLRLKLSWHGPLVWVAHLDRMRAIERTLLRAGLPLAFSQGFNPRPQLVFALPSGVGIESDAEYIDISLKEPIEEAAALAKVSAVLPEGLQVLAVKEIPISQATHLMAGVRLCDYLFVREGLGEPFQKMLHLPELEVLKFSKGKEKPLNILPLIVNAKVDSDQVWLRCKAGSRENLKPDLILAALGQVGDVRTDECRVIRQDLWILPEKQAKVLVRPIPTDDEEIPWDGE